jgi:O-antigen/teichoic acid export membrane protein
MVWFVASYAVALLGYLGLNAVAGRWLGPGQFGYFVVVLTVTGLLGQVGLVGVHRSGLREAARLRNDESPEALARLRNGVRAIHLTTLPLTGLLGAGGTWFVASGQPLPTRLGLCCGVGLLIVLGGQQKMWANYLRGFGYVKLASLVEGRSGGAFVAGTQALLVVAAWQLFPQWGLVGAVGAVAAGYALPILVARRAVTRRWQHLVGPRPHLARDLKGAVRRDWRFLSVQVATYLNISVDVWIAALLLTNVETSMFTAALRLAQLLQLPMTGLQVVFSPAIARLTAQEDHRDRVQALLRTGATLAAALTALVWLPMLIAPGLVLDVVYGPGFGSAVPVLLLLAAGFITNVLMGLAGTTLSMSGREGLAAQVQWAGVILRVVVGVPAAMLGGVVALAVTSTVTSTLVFVVMWMRTRRQTGVSTHVTLRPDLRLLRRTAG